MSLEKEDDFNVNGTNGVKNGLDYSTKSKENPLDATFVPNTEDEDKDKEDKKDDAPPVSFLKLYAYASTRDKICIAFGLLGACVTGCTTPVNTLIFGNLIESMVSQASNLAQRYFSNRQLDDAFTDIFLDQVTWFAIYSCILGVVMLVGTYVSIMLFNFAAHSQIFRIRGNFLRSVLNQDIAWYDVNQSGEFASRMNENLQCTMKRHAVHRWYIINIARIISISWRHVNILSVWFAGKKSGCLWHKHASLSNFCTIHRRFCRCFRIRSNSIGRHITTIV